MENGNKDNVYAYHSVIALCSEALTVCCGYYFNLAASSKS